MKISDFGLSRDIYSADYYRLANSSEDLSEIDIWWVGRVLRLFTLLTVHIFFHFAFSWTCLPLFLCLTSSNTVEDKIPDETNDSQVKSISSVQLWSEGGVALIELKCIAVINANWHGCASHGFPRVQEPSIYVSLKSAMQIVGGCCKREIWTWGWNFQNLWAGFKPSRCCQYGGCHQVIFKSHNRIC